MECEKYPKEKIIRMIEGCVGRENLEGCVGRRNNDIVILPESDVIPPKNNKVTETIDLILYKVQSYDLVMFKRIFKKMIPNVIKHL